MHVIPNNPTRGPLHPIPALLMLAALSTQLAAAPQGKLDAFETDARQKADKPVAKSSASDYAPHSYGSNDDDDEQTFTEGFIKSILGLGGTSMLYGGVESWQRVAGDASVSSLAPRHHGDPKIPFARIDFAFMRVSETIDALDLLMEVGYGPFAAQYAHTRYDESSPSDTLDVTHLLGLYRMTFSNWVEADLGLGALTLDGNETTHRFAISTPLLIHSPHHWGIEFRPLWSSLAARYDLAALATWKNVSLKLGYRWLRAKDESLNGPHLGLSLRY